MFRVLPIMRLFRQLATLSFDHQSLWRARLRPRDAYAGRAYAGRAYPCCFVSIALPF